MSDYSVIEEIKMAINALPAKARPYLLALVAAEDGINPLLLDILNRTLADAHAHMGDEHIALVGVHLHTRAGNEVAASRDWASITYAGTDAEARAAIRFMISLPALLQAAQARLSH